MRDNYRQGNTEFKIKTEKYLQKEKTEQEYAAELILRMQLI